MRDTRKGVAFVSQARLRQDPSEPGIFLRDEAFRPAFLFWRKLVIFRHLETMKKHGQKKLGQLENIENDLILESLSEGVCVVGTDRKIIFANRSAVAMLDYESAADLIGESYDIVLFHQDKTLSEDELSVCPVQFALFDGAASQTNGEYFFRSNGSPLLVEYRCTPIFEDDETVGAVVTFEDISERRELEAVISAARESALETARVKAVFLANMSHEIRTPLSGIVGTTNLLLDTKLTEEQRRYLQTLQKSVDLLMETVNDILDFSKIEAGKLTLETINFNLSELVEETIGLFEFSAHKKQLDLRFSVTERATKNYRGDAGKIRQVLNNFLNNAIKFTEKGEIFLKVSPSLESNNSLLFEVYDTGIGIGELEQKKLFEPFIQADVSMSRRFGGTGLGLAICREIVELMGGEIGIESVKGEGSRFWFSIPLQEISESEGLFEESGDIFKKVKSPNNKGKLHILIAEDDNVNREITTKMLEQLGYETVSVENGTEAVRKASETDFDLILMDCRMPETDGFAATEMIRSLQKKHRPKIVALTAFSAETEREKCFASGMDDYLQKPVTKNDLVKILYQHFPAKNLSLNLDLEEKFGQHFLSEIVNPEILKNLLAIESRGEKNFVFEILQIFCENAEKQLAELRTDLHRRDAKAIARRAHSLKGSSANVGLEKLTKAFEDLQTSAVLENWTQVVTLFAEIIENFEDIKLKVFEKR